MATTMTEIPIKDLALTTAPAGKQLLVRDASARLQRIDYAQIAKNLVESYGSSSLAGKNQTIKAAIDSLNSGLTQCNTNITTINNSLSKFNGYLTRTPNNNGWYKWTMPDGTIFAMGRYDVYISSGNAEGSFFFFNYKCNIPNNIFTSDGIYFLTQVEMPGGYGCYYVIGDHNKTAINGQFFTDLKTINRTATLYVFGFQ